MLSCCSRQRPSAASRPARRSQIESRDTPPETSSIRVIDVRRQIKSLSGDSPKKRFRRLFALDPLPSDRRPTPASAPEAREQDVLFRPKFLEPIKIRGGDDPT